MSLLPIPVIRNGRWYYLTKLDIRTYIDENGVKHWYITTYLVPIK